jgi:hypothetical protein
MCDNVAGSLILLKHMTQKSKFSGPIKWLAIAAVVTGLGAAAYYGVSVCLQSMVIKPEQVLEQQFGLGVNDVVGLQGNGRSTGQYDVWIRFTTDRDKKVELKDMSGFLNQPPLEAQRWFMQCLPDDNGLRHVAGDFTLLAKEFDSGANVKREWLLNNFKTGDYYYRYWGQ